MNHRILAIIFIVSSYVHSVCAQSSKIATQNDACFVISDVHVQANGLHGVQAQEHALLLACTKAFTQLLAQISYYNTTKPRLSPKQIKNMLVRYSVSDENISEKTYSASFTMHFSQKKVLRLCFDHKIPLKDAFPNKDMHKTVKVRKTYSLSSWPEVVRKLNDDGIFYIPCNIHRGQRIEVDVVQSALASDTSTKSENCKT